MRILFIGGSGNISSACTWLALEKGHEVIHFNRGKSTDYAFKNVKTIYGDINLDQEREKIKQYAPYDAIANWICFTPDQIKRDIEFFENLTNQYIFISSATVYQKPPENYLITEEVPLSNPFWKYAQDKIACEKLLVKAGEEGKIKYTIVRPSYTYGNTWIPVAFTARIYNPAARILAGKPIISHGDGQSLWVMTHHTDFAKGFVGLFGRKEAINNHFHITSDEVLTWDQIYNIIGRVLGKEPKLIHIPSDFINNLKPEWGSFLLGDKACSMVFDNSKIKTLVPEFNCTTRFEEGISKSLRWFHADKSRQAVDESIEKEYDRIIDFYLKNQD